MTSAYQRPAWNLLTGTLASYVLLGVTIVLEHIPFGGNEQLEDIVAIMASVPLLRFHLDSGHAKLERGYDRWDEYLERLGHKLMHVHLSDNDGTADQHLPLGAPRSTMGSVFSPSRMAMMNITVR